MLIKNSLEMKFVTVYHKSEGKYNRNTIRIEKILTFKNNEKSIDKYT